MSVLQARSNKLQSEAAWESWEEWWWWEEGEGLTCLFPGLSLPPADFLLMESELGLEACAPALPLHWALLIRMPGSQALGPWHAAHSGLSLLLP